MLGLLQLRPRALDVLQQFALGRREGRLVERLQLGVDVEVERLDLAPLTEPGGGER